MRVYLILFSQFFFTWFLKVYLPLFKMYLSFYFHKYFTHKVIKIIYIFIIFSVLSHLFRLQFFYENVSVFYHVKKQTSYVFFFIHFNLFNFLNWDSRRYVFNKFEMSSQSTSLKFIVEYDFNLI